MSGIRRVAGLGFDGSLVTTSFGKVEIRCVKASFGDKLDKGTLSLMGSQEIDEITPGSYSTEDLKVTMSAVRFRTEFMPAMPATGGGNVRMPVVIGRAHPDMGDDSDLCEDCQYMGATGSVENSNKPEEVELTFKVRQVKWTNERKTINQLAGTVPAGAIGF